MVTASAVEALLLVLLPQARAFVPMPSSVPRAYMNQNNRQCKNGYSWYTPDPLQSRRSLEVSAVTGDVGVRGEENAPVVLCHGEILFDCIAKPEAAGWDLERVVETAAWTPHPGGAPANVACALSKLGVPASFVGAVGRDDQGDELLGVLEASGVGTELASKIDNRPTRTVMVTRDISGDRTFAGFGGGKPSDSFADCQHRLIDRKDEAMSLLRPGSWLVQGTLGLACPGSMESHVCLAEWAKEAGATRYLDVNWRPVFWELAAREAGGDYEALARERITDFSRTADVVKLTNEEATWLCGVSGEEAFTDPSLLTTFFPSAKAILVTAGERGASFDIRGRTGFVPPFQDINVVETTGAGDAFSAGFIAQAIKLFSPIPSWSSDSSSSSSGDVEAVWERVEDEGVARDMVRFASAVGALTCCGDGAIAPQPSEEDVRRLLLQGIGNSS